MIIRSDTNRIFPIENCHGGKGALICREILGEYERLARGIKFIHDNVLEPGVSIGEHRHDDDEEAYVILEGEGMMLVDGESTSVAAGDICLTRPGHSHSLVNTGPTPMRLLVVGVNVI